MKEWTSGRADPDLYQGGVVRVLEVITDNKDDWQPPIWYKLKQKCWAGIRATAWEMRPLRETRTSRRTRRRLRAGEDPSGAFAQNVAQMRQRLDQLPQIPVWDREPDYALLDALAGLRNSDPRMFRVVYRIVVEGYTSTEVAEELGLSPSWIRQLKGQALDQLRTLLSGGTS